MSSQEADQLNEFFSAFLKDLFPEKSIFWLWEFPSGTAYLNGPHQDLQFFSGKEKLWKEKIYPQDQARFIEHLDDLVSDKTGNAPSLLSHRMEISSGNYQPVFTRFQIVGRDEAGFATRIMAISFDLKTVSHLKQIQKDAERFPHVLEALKAGLWEWDTEINETSFSPYYASMMGYDPDQFPQHLNSWTERVHPEDINQVMNYQYSYINFPHYGDVFENTYRFRAADNTYKWITSDAKVIKRNAEGRATRILGVHTVTDKLYETNLALADIAYTDHLTGLANRLAFDTKLATLTKENYPVSLIYIDVDGLKQVNDNLGHEAGDHLLKIMAQLVRQSFRVKDMIARVGGDEFVVLLPNCSVDDAEQLMKVIRLACDEYNANPENLPVFISMGVASTQSDTGIFQLQLEADKKMIQQKRKEARKNYKILKQWITKNTEKKIK